MVSYANLDVLSFYKQLPFNYGESAEGDAERIRKTDITRTYPVLAPILKARPRILEVGCGAGWLSCGIAHRWRCDVTAIDFNPVAIERARAIARQMQLAVRFEVADLFTYKPESPADLVISIGVLHHTDNCHEAIRICIRDFTAPSGHFLLGLYHTFGRRPFLDHFRNLQAAGAGEEQLLGEYARLHHWLPDKTHLRSWFRDQVLHPHETQHSLAEILPLAEECGAKLVATSINRFAPLTDLAEVLAKEPEYEQMAEARLKQGEYFPGFFIALFQRQS